MSTASATEIKMAKEWLALAKTNEESASKRLSKAKATKKQMMDTLNEDVDDAQKQFETSQRDIQLAKERLASAEAQNKIASKWLDEAKMQAAKMLETLSVDVDEAKEQLSSSQSEVKKATKSLKDAEKRGEVVTIDSDLDEEARGSARIKLEVKDEDTDNEDNNNVIKVKKEVKYEDTDTDDDDDDDNSSIRKNISVMASSDAWKVLEPQRTLPSQLISSEEALNILTNNYNIDNNNSFARYYCLPGVESRLGCDYFETPRDLRASLCAYGLPPVASGSKLSNDSERKLEAWVRCANIESLCFSSEKSSLVPIKQTATPNVPEFEKVLFNKAKKVLKAFGYTISANTHTFLLPGTTTMHNSKLGHDQFDQVIDLINHIARFGLDTSHKSTDCQISDEEKTKFEIFCASVATFDVR